MPPLRKKFSPSDQPTLPLVTPQRLSYADHCEKWAGGCGSNICEGATKVFARGVIPAEVLFVGEAPGESEESLCKPFAGPAGKLMDYMIQQAIPDEVRKAYCNLVCCIPRTEDGGKAGEPPDESIILCQPRLQEFLRMADPKLVVCVGRLSADFVEDDAPGVYRYALRLPKWIRRITVVHPAAILRANPAHKGLLIQRWSVTLRNAYFDLQEGK